MLPYVFLGYCGKKQNNNNKFLHSPTSFYRLMELCLQSDEFNKRWE